MLLERTAHARYVRKSGSDPHAPRTTPFPHAFEPGAPIEISMIVIG